ncbi:type II toxin-antitoxin system RelE/ParE family toxin [Bosea caraganae]|uniref:Type II toxin-antitoxin system RelE/ParE family toxin n=1 Tax=Bosea caraganae TaxID=2763117 RepID=A0A370KYZ9_9HYPH|nr:type II toxin-antitoxin system RelE/ParE family toxin [Bosea caraganae]RDJ19842.1 type II toxin-antitoxin system RelE/ParE family toxin [Bosea caraganae]RDJ25572.1 type II toxin-antitoxin system RelE/ParE family toxin [Bosea caraganae]
MGFRILPQAMSDIEAITAWIKADNPVAAQRWFDDLYRRFDRLGDMPGMGVLRADISERVRLFPIGSYVVLYHEETHGVDIVRVSHGKRDPETWLDKLG